jgi:hypothetical protein
MSQVIAHTNTVRNRLLAALLALIATVSVVLVVAIGDDSSNAPSSQPATAGRPDESAIAASIAGPAHSPPYARHSRTSQKVPTDAISTSSPNEIAL